ncbi:MAG: adenylosuccinate lyase [Verrucomicrobiota bacterium]
MDRNTYENPLVERYASEAMSYNWSPQKKFSTWRRLWLALAQAQKELGLDIKESQLEEMRRYLDNINFATAEAKEKELRHDVMSHVHALAEQCPNAAPVIHLGATSCFVTDNTELVQLREGLNIIRQRLIELIRALKDYCRRYKELATLGFTHFQPAQLTTVGKRGTLWLYDTYLDLKELDKQLEGLPFRGAKGTTGTQASFLALFEGDEEKVKSLDRRVAELMGFDSVVPVCGQTYTRKYDYQILSLLSGIAQTASKAATDIRLLAHRKEVEEPFGKSQVGSSAMAYKRNPMRCERVCSLARYVISLTANPANTHANQWLERTLDDSANRRLSLPEAFLGTEVILTVLTQVISGLQVWPKVIAANVEAELPFMATENIIMACVRAGGDRQQLHEAIRRHSMDASRRIKEEGGDNDLLERIESDPLFEAVHGRLDEILDVNQFVGRAPQQVEDFICEYIESL